MIRAMIGAGITVIAVSLLIFSLGATWYNLSIEGAEEEGEVDIDRDFYLDKMEITEDGETITLDYEEEGMNEISYLFRTTELFVTIAVVGSIIGLAGAILVGLDVVKPTIGGTLAVIGVIFAFLAPVYLWWSLSETFEEDLDINEVGPQEGRLYFMGRGSVGEEERSWGPSIAWFIVIGAGVLNGVSSGIIRSSRPKKRKNKR